MLAAATAIVEQRLAFAFTEIGFSMTQPFEYGAITTDSNYAPLRCQLRDTSGSPVLATGSTVAVTVKDELTGETIVQDSAGTVSVSNPYEIEYLFASNTVALITRVTTWLVEWKITAVDSRVYRSPVPCRLPVRPKL